MDLYDRIRALAGRQSSTESTDSSPGEPIDDAPPEPDSDVSQGDTDPRDAEIERLISNSEVSVEALRVEREEYRRAIDRRFATLDGFNEKAIRIIEINAAVLTIIITGATLLAESATYVNIFTVSAVGLFLCSIGLALAAYQNVTIQRSGGTVNTVFHWDRPVDERVHAIWYLKKIYPNWTAKLDPVIHRRAWLVTWALRVFIAGIFAFVAGIVFATLPALSEMLY